MITASTMRDFRRGYRAGQTIARQNGEAGRYYVTMELGPYIGKGYRDEMRKLSNRAMAGLRERKRAATMRRIRSAR